jgi:hypothetical protein
LIEGSGALSNEINELRSQLAAELYSLRDVERRPVVLCSFKRIEGGSAYQKNLLRKIRRILLDSGFF